LPRKKKNTPEGGKAVDITAFLGGPQPPQEKTRDRGGETPTQVEAPRPAGDVVDLVYRRIKESPGGIGKSELYRWAKAKGVKPADLYRAILQLVSQGRIKRRFDPEKEEYVYVAAA